MANVFPADIIGVFNLCLCLSFGIIGTIGMKCLASILVNYFPTTLDLYGFGHFIIRMDSYKQDVRLHPLVLLASFYRTSYLPSGRLQNHAVSDLVDLPLGW